VSSPVDVFHDFLCLSFSVIATLYNVTYSHVMYCTVCLTIHCGLLWAKSAQNCVPLIAEACNLIL